MEWPSDQELLDGNRRLFAERQHWPDGALAACESIDADHPGWYTTWRDGNTWSGDKAGYYAYQRKPSGTWEHPPLYAATPDDLRAEIETHPLVEPPPFTPLDVPGRD